MKKQVFILSLFVMAAFAFTNKSFGQGAVHTSDPRPISCSGDALHPIAGRPYTYKASSTQAGNYTFWATKDPNFITSSGSPLVTTTNIATRLTTPTDLITTSANYAAANSSDSLQITWSDLVLGGTDATHPTFVAVLKDGTCANNFNAWSLQPINAFAVDIKNLNHSSKASLAYDATEDQCFDQVRGAAWNGAQMQYNYGTNVIYFEVVAANFTNTWTPTFTLSGLGNGQTAVIEWDYSTAFSAPVTVTSGTASATAVTTSATNTSNGVSIYVRVTVSNNTYEGTVATNVSLAVDGQNSVGNWDIVNATCAATSGADQADSAMQTLDPRPTVAPVAPTPFVPGNQTN